MDDKQYNELLADEAKLNKSEPAQPPTVTKRLRATPRKRVRFWALKKQQELFIEGWKQPVFKLDFCRVAINPAKNAWVWPWQSVFISRPTASQKALLCGVIKAMRITPYTTLLEGGVFPAGVADEICNVGKPEEGQAGNECKDQKS